MSYLNSTTEVLCSPLVTGLCDSTSSPRVSSYTDHVRYSVATSAIATTAVRNGARLITHLFNAMPQLHHRDPSIIGLLGASPHLETHFSPITAQLYSGMQSPVSKQVTGVRSPIDGSEAFDQNDTPPQTPLFRGGQGGLTPTSAKDFTRPFYELIVDGIHSHPNSVRVSLDVHQESLILKAPQLAYSAYPEGCILITDGQTSLALWS